jgi:hypothetical protein
MKKKYTHLNTLAAIAGLALTATSANAALLAVDFGSSGVESGFVGQTNYSTTHSTTAGNVSVDITDSPEGYYSYVGGGTNAALFDDFIYDNSGPFTMTLSGPGISANTEYDMTICSYYGAQARNTTITAASGTTGTTLGPIAFVNPPTSLSDNSATGTFTSDGSGNLTLSLGGSRPAINGFTITAVPEPSTTALLGLGGLTLIMRRRK